MKNKKIIALGFSISGKGHFIHREWFKAVDALVVPYVPQTLLPFVKRFPLIGAVISLCHSFFLPKADVYILDGIGAVTSVLFKRGIVIAINSDPFFRNLPMMSFLKRKIVQLFIKRIDGYISTSTMMYDLAQHYTKKPNKIVYPFIDVKKYSALKPNLQSIDVCSVGMGTAKGTNRVIEAFKLYKRKYPEAKLYVLGIWPKGDPQKMIIYKDVITPRFVDPATYFEKCGLVVNGSFHESFGANIIESMCAGIPPLVTEHCGAKEFIEDKYLITTLDPKDIYKKMVVLHNNKKAYMLSKKYRKIGQQFTKQKSLRDFKKGIEMILKELS